MLATAGIHIRSATSMYWPLTIRVASTVPDRTTTRTR